MSDTVFVGVLLADGKEPDDPYYQRQPTRLIVRASSTLTVINQYFVRFPRATYDWGDVLSLVLFTEGAEVIGGTAIQNPLAVSRGASAAFAPGAIEITINIVHP